MTTVISLKFPSVHNTQSNRPRPLATPTESGEALRDGGKEVGEDRRLQTADEVHVILC